MSIKISQLSEKTTPSQSGSEEVLINDGGISKKMTALNLTALSMPLVGGTFSGKITTTEVEVGTGYKLQTSYLTADEADDTPVPSPNIYSQLYTDASGIHLKGISPSSVGTSLPTTITSTGDLNLLTSTGNIKLIAADSTEGLNMLPDANVGFSVTPEAWNGLQTALQVGGTAALSSTTGVADGNITNYSQNAYLHSSGEWRRMTVGTASVMTQTGSSFVFKTKASGPIDADIGFATRFTIDASGVTSEADVTAYSDARLKSDVQDIPEALEKVCSIRGVTFDMNGKRGTGVIAQELEEVLPEAVKDNENGFKSVAYGNVVGLLIQAVKEQQVMIEELSEEVELMKRNR